MVHFNQQIHLQLQENMSILESELERKTEELEQYKHDKALLQKMKEADTTSTERRVDQGIAIHNFIASYMQVDNNSVLAPGTYS